MIFRKMGSYESEDELRKLIDDLFTKYNASDQSGYKPPNAFYRKFVDMITELSKEEGFDIYDVLAIKLFLNEKIEQIIDRTLQRNGVELDRSDIEAESTRRITGEIFWGNGWFSRLEAEVILARLSKAISYTKCQQPYGSDPETVEYMEKMDAQTQGYAKNILNDFANAVFGMDAELVPSQTQLDYYQEQYDKLICSECPYSEFDNYVENEGNVYCLLRDQNVYLPKHPAVCPAVDKIGLDNLIDRISSEHCGEKALNWSLKYNKILQESGPVPPAIEEETKCEQEEILW